MAENKSGPYEPGVYVKGDEQRVARSRSVAVALVFDGYRLKEDAEAPAEQPASEAPTETANQADPTPKPRAPKREAEKSQEDQTK